MINKNDLRYIKTEKLLESTYMALKKKTKASIKVSELCSAALINKTTFYLHYDCIEMLHNHLCKKAVDEVLRTCPHINEAFTDTQAFVGSLAGIWQREESDLFVLFGDNTDMLLNRIEDSLLKIYLTDEVDADMEMLIIFAIGGASRLLIKSHDENRVKTAIDLIERLFRNKESEMIFK